MRFADSSPSVPAAGVLAEAVTFDPGVVVAVLLVFALLCIVAAVVAVVGVVAGYRSGMDPDNGRAATAWWVCLALEVVAVVVALATWAPTVIHLVVWGALGASCLAHLAGRSTQRARR